ncbi:myeloid leukemia factor 2-like [Amblyomma americanum]|uniref:Putative myeloid leukemia factor-like protein n=1 Tax=Amblyomma americanum TaxID=6943 RepID=A0A0C9SDJ1_AMBAM
MALFGSLMRDLDSDPFFGGGPFEGMRQMEAMMDSMLGPMLGAFPGLGGTRRSASLGLFPTDMFSTIGHLTQDPNCHSFSSSSVMTMTTDEHGQPQVYQASQSTRMAPGGVKETRRSLQDSRSGLQELTIGHHLDDRAHIVGRKRNRRTGEEDETVEYVNLDEEEAEGFSREWHQRAQCMTRPRSMYAALPSRGVGGDPLPALTAPPTTRGETSFAPSCQQQQQQPQRVEHRSKRRAKSKQRTRHETSM